MRIAVTGDITMDWNIADAAPQTTVARWSDSERSAISFAPGGACLLGHILSAALDAEVIAPSEGPIPRPDDRRHHHSTVLWSQYPRSDRDRSPAWRVNDHIGVTRADAEGSADGWGELQDHADVDLVVLNDSGLGFRTDRSAWPQVLTELDASRSVVLKMGFPVHTSELLDHVLDSGCSLIAITTGADLRRSGLGVGAGLSWEAICEDVAGSVERNEILHRIVERGDLIVSLGAAGAVILEQGTDGRVLFDANSHEGEWEGTHPGGMVGATSCLAAGIVAAVVAEPKQPDLTDGTKRGIAALRALHLTGYVSSDDHGVAFPIAAVAEALATPEPLAEAPLPADQPVGTWSIMSGTLTSGLEAVAEQIVRVGLETSLPGIPQGRFGHLVTVDREEIEGLRSIRDLMAEYCSLTRPPRPLCVAVFGPPGSGKSFAVKQLARSLPQLNAATLTFNLSQLDSPESLVDAFHQVRDIGLSDQVPMAIWDEFDTSLDGTRLGWLHHFLAPMQDGEFQRGPLIHPIGRAIFVFAGGTAHRLDGLEAGFADEPATWRAVKGPDFLSRLRGFVDIRGIDPDPQKPGAHLVRRAILLRSLLQRTCPHLVRRNPDGVTRVNIGDGVLSAFLRTTTYRHGVRSMEAIISMSRLADETAYHYAALPSAHQLELHTEATEFLSIAGAAIP